VTREVAKPVLVENAPPETKPTAATLTSKVDSPAHAEVPEHKSSAPRQKKTAWTAKREALLDQSP
jgi:hypothetical protein